MTRTEDFVKVAKNKIAATKPHLVIPNGVRNRVACETAELEEVSSKVATVYDYQPIPHYVRNDKVWFG